MDNLGASEPLTSALLLRGQGERQLVRENDLPRAAALAAGLQPEENFVTIFLDEIKLFIFSAIALEQYDLLASTCM